MKLISTHPSIKEQVRAWRGQQKTIGFVPTMGALHLGHLSLVQACQKSCDVTVVSIFVNPLQFGPNEDLAHYPRDLDADMKKLNELRVDLVFTTTPDEMYPAGFQTHVQPGALASPLCGSSRADHFRGVTTVVMKLFHLIQPHRSFFGQKDYQQARVLSQMVTDLNLDHELNILPTVREADGLAMSSRNQLLSPDERKAAPRLHQSLRQVERAFDAGERHQETLVQHGLDALAGDPRFRVDYFEVRDDMMLEEIPVLDSSAVVAGAVFLGKTRLIDNLLLGDAKKRLGP